MFAFDHAGLESSDIDADVAFYTGAMGLRLIRWGVHTVTGGRIAMLVGADGVKIELIEVAERTGRFAHTAFRVDDVAVARDGVEGAGASVVQQLVHIDAARADSCLVTTPGAAALQLIAYSPDSPDLTGTH